MGLLSGKAWLRVLNRVRILTMLLLRLKIRKTCQPPLRYIKTNWTWFKPIRLIQALQPPQWEEGTTGSGFNPPSNWRLHQTRLPPMQVWECSCLYLGLTSKCYFTHMRRTLNTPRIILMTTSKTLIILLMAPERCIRAPLTSISKPGSNSPKSLKRTHRQPSDPTAASAGIPKRRRRKSSQNSHSAVEIANLARAASLPRKPKHGNQ